MNLLKSLPIFGAALVLLLGFWPNTALSFGPPSQPRLPNFDKRLDGAAKDKRLSEAGAAAAERLRARVPHLRIDLDEVLGTPKMVGSPDGFLSGPNGEGRGISPDKARALPARDPHRAVKAFLNEHPAMFGHGAEGLAAAEVSGVDADPVGAEKRQRFKAGTLPGEARARLVWLPMDRSTLRRCWEIDLTRHQGGETYRLLIDAQTGEVLVRRCLTFYLSDATYRVYTGESPSPFSPGYPTPTTNQPPLVPRSLITLSAVDTNASPIGWISDGENETRGNNVDAHLDRNADNQPDFPRPHGSPVPVFDLPLDLTQSPDSYGDPA